jgi:hypothetical protein
MSEKIPRYQGGSGTGVDLTVLLENGEAKPRHFDQGDEVPSEIGGVPVAQSFIDGLLQQDVWGGPSADEQTAAAQETEPELKGKALDDRAAELEIAGRGSMTAPEKRAAIAAREAELAAAGVPDPDIAGEQLADDAAAAEPGGEE